jgi:hypothetical protein
VPREHFLFAVWLIAGSEAEIPAQIRNGEFEKFKLSGLDESRFQTSPHEHRETGRLIP